jgi:hypothetical protein
MNCLECMDLLGLYVEGSVDDRNRGLIDTHLKECSACRSELNHFSQLHQLLLADQKRFNRQVLETAVMNRILQEQTFKLRSKTMVGKLAKVGLGLISAAAAIALAVLVWGGFVGTKSAAADVLNQGIQAVTNLNLHSVHIKARMRTIAHDNFLMIGVKCDFVDHDLWKEFTNPPKWRVEKSGRVIVDDGTQQIRLIKPNIVGKGKGGPSAGAHFLLGSLLDVDKVLESEQARAKEKGWPLTLDYAVGKDGRAKLVVTVEAKAEGDYTNDWLKNKSVQDSDNRRVYTFDARSKLLEGLQVYIHTGQEDILVFEITGIEYNVELPSGLFALNLPKDVIQFQEPRILPDNYKYQKMTPEEMARAFFQACADENWEEMNKFWCMSSVSQRIKDYLGGLKIISIGKAFKSGSYAGWYVPYEIRLKSGEMKKYNLAVRNDNLAMRYVEDGGI